ncbi:MAG: hypothetical protein WAW45_04745 [Atribacterota bacterium]
MTRAITLMDGDIWRPHLFPLNGQRQNGVGYSNIIGAWGSDIRTGQSNTNIINSKLVK